MHSMSSVFPASKQVFSIGLELMDSKLHLAVLLLVSEWQRIYSTFPE